ncbi:MULTISPECIES: DUF2061 domain-containing protein [Acinetobacter]|uniref:DUF2061 domain-containing protein n=1 Tax=Acinetobacter amyesii TaxID=2942470 RepID=A0A1T1H419_9GAMM|nr:MULTISPECIES: DUF2061 domain-containing protein [Acinetobacter]MCL6247465.1 DUF2061 domain-containing protein [Acinetobacter amyesii]OOV84571.1 hypothetical protein B1202_06295 [Acinetobacter amyesii]UIJ75357.1 DUF2061 domain-containing protein [Acinetobacter sp. SH20PTE14]UUS58024.1 DUF2061 domain-containing protein [Acinetobacter sp. YH16040_T]UUS60446.1 DUF2061 domain-containing protein [Acinetobacter sp. YH16056_T]
MAHINKFVENNQRMFKKTLSYYIMHITVAMLVGYYVTGSIAMAITLSLLEPTVQAVAFFFHEKAWEKKDKAAEENIPA